MSSWSGVTKMQHYVHNAALCSIKNHTSDKYVNIQCTMITYCWHAVHPWSLLMLLCDNHATKAVKAFLNQFATFTNCNAIFLHNLPVDCASQFIIKEHKEYDLKVPCWMSNCQETASPDKSARGRIPGVFRTKVLRVFHLAIQSPCTTNGFYSPLPLEQKWFKTGL